MKEQYKIAGYHITTDPRFNDERFGITNELSDQLESLYYECQDEKNKKIIQKLIDLILKYPKAPILKNYLSIAYNTHSNYAKTIEVNNWLLAEHPDYLFGKLNLANSWIEKNEADKVPAILGKALEIKSLYPERKVFHLAEVTSYFKTVIRYLVAIEDLELAENRLKLLLEIAPEHHDTEQAEMFLMPLRIKVATERWKEEEKCRISPKVNKTLPEKSNNIAPHFNHSEIKYLYEFGFHIAHEKIREILALPRKSVITDLENVLNDAVGRYSYFVDEDYEEDTRSFVLHAFFLLKELNAVESLPEILSFLEYGSDFLDYWLGEHKTETLWQSLYSLGLSNIQILKEFLLKPGIDTYSKTAVSEALCQMLLYNQARKSEFLSIYSEILTCFVNASTNDNLIDPNFNALMIGDCIDCKLSELLPVIKQLYEKQIVSLGINGDYDEVLRHFKDTKHDIYKKKKLFNIFELYDDVLSTWHGYKDNEDSDYSYTPPIIQQAVSGKIGRNEPCPCGSGKKYKKCCWGK